MVQVWFCFKVIKIIQSIKMEIVFIVRFNDENIFERIIIILFLFMKRILNEIQEE